MHDRKPQAAIALLTAVFVLLGLAGGVVIVPPAYAEETYTISGTITTGGTTPLPGIYVVVTDWGEVTEYALTDALGDYEIPGLPYGDYAVFINTAPDDFGEEMPPPEDEYFYYENEIQSLLTLGSNQTIDEDLDLVGGSISGKVTDGLSELQGVEVTVVGMSGFEDYTDANGDYRIGQIPTGSDYTVRFYGGEVYGEEFEDNIAVTEAGDTQVNHDFSNYDGSISGTVTEQGSDPVVYLDGCTVTLYEGDYENDLLSVNPNPLDGSYSFISLQDGNYKVKFEMPGTTYFNEWYNDLSIPGGTTWATATVITISDGEAETGIDAALIEAASISGNVKEVGSNDNLSGQTVEIYQVGSETKVTGADGVTDANGDFTCGPLLAGSYHVKFVGDTTHKAEWYDDKATRDAPATTVACTTGQQVTGINAYLTATGTVSGRVTGNESGNPGAYPCKVEFWGSGETAEATAYTDANGDYSVGLWPGSYKIYFDGNTTHLSEWNQDKSSKETADAVVVESTGEYTVNATLAQAFGTISGTVTGSENPGVGLSSISVTLYDSSDQQIGTTTTNTSGFYSFGNRPTGVYKLQFGGNSTHLGEYYNDKTTVEEADQVSVTIPSTTTVNVSLTQAFGSISGMVVGNETGYPPIIGMTVKIYNSSYSVVKTTATDGEGMYYSGDLPAGNYKIYFAGQGSYRKEYYNNKKYLVTGNWVGVTLLQNSDASTMLGSTAGTVSGTVTGSENPGVGLTGIPVKLYDDEGNETGSTTTNSSGNYSFGSLWEGYYRVWFGGNSSHLPEYNLDKTTLELADAVFVESGETADVDAQLAQAFGSISGKVTGSEAPTVGLVGMTVFIYDSGDVLKGFTTTNANGDYSYGNLTTGNYKVGFGGDTTHLGEYYNNQSLIGEANLVSVTIPNTTSNINAELTQAFGSITGKVTGSEAPTVGIPDVPVTVYTSGDQPAGSTSTDSSGNYSVGSLPTGSYKVQFGNNPSHLGEFYNNQADLASANLVSVTIPSATPNINAELTQAFGSISGKVTGSENPGVGLPGITVSVFNAGYQQVGSTSTDGNGNYLVGSIPSGSYTVYFWGDTGHLSEYYNNQTRWEEANLVSVTIPVNTPNINAELTPLAGSISGTVTGSEAPAVGLEGIVVTVYNASQQPVGTDTTDENGDYYVGSISPGTYRVHFGGDTTHLAVDKTGVVVLAGQAVDCDKMLQAFYTISASVEGGNGSVDPASQNINYGANASITLSPATHYHVASITDNSAPVDGPYGSTYVITNVTQAHNVVVTFAIDTNNITASAGENGSISPSGTVPVDYEADQAFTITPNAHYHVADVLVDGESVGAVTSYTFYDVTTSHTIAASFAIDTNNITASAGEGGSISPSGTVPVNYEDDQSFVIDPDDGYYITDVLVDGLSVGAQTSYTFYDVVTTHTISTSFGFGSISGTVTGSEAPTVGLEGIVVKAYDYTSGDPVGTNGTTNGSGVYTITNLPTGTYKVEFGGNGNHLGEWYDVAEPVGADQVDVTIPDTTTDINAELAEAYGSISGTVTKSDGVTPISGSRVYVYNGITNAYTGFRGIPNEITGFYNISGLPGGTYKVYFVDPSNVHQNEWYNNLKTMPEVANVSMSAGENLNLGNAALAYAQGSITGKVTKADGVTPISGSRVYVYNGYTGAYTGFRGIPNETTGVYTISGLPIGTYKVYFVDPSNGHLNEWYNDLSTAPSKGNVIVYGEEITDLGNASLAAVGNITGTVTDQVGNPISGSRVYVYNGITNSYTGFRGCPDDTTGAYTISRLPVGTYKVFFVDPSYRHVNEWYNNLTTRPEVANVTISVGVTTNLGNASLNAIGSITGTVTKPDGMSPISGSRVYVYDGISNAYTGFRGCPNDTTGAYTISGLPVGTYKVYFVDPSGSYLNEWYDNLATMPEVANVTVTIGATTNLGNAALTLK